MITPTLPGSLSGSRASTICPPRMDTKKLRACMVCGAVQSSDVFLSTGCPNCTTLPADRVHETTTAAFLGLVGTVQTGWVARWLRLEDKKPGMYALRVVGRLPEDILDTLEARNVRPVVNRTV